MFTQFFPLPVAGVDTRTKASWYNRGYRTGARSLNRLPLVAARHCRY